jgi:hypothetical protein
VWWIETSTGVAFAVTFYAAMCRLGLTSCVFAAVTSNIGELFSFPTDRVKEERVETTIVDLCGEDDPDAKLMEG